MQVYLPIAEISIEIYSIILLGLISGFMAGIFGIGGNFIAIPTLIFIGIPSAIALSSAVSHIVASSFSSFLSHLRNKNVDLGIGLWLIIGSMIGSLVGAIIFSFLYSIGVLDIFISLSYVIILGIVGVTIGIESIKAIHQKNKKKPIHSIKKKRVSKLSKLMPYKHHFIRSNVEVSIVAIILIGSLIGLLVSLAGLGGGFVLVPLLIYVLGLPTSLAIGTSVFQAVLTTSFVTIFHAVTAHTVDVVLSFFLILGAVIGAQIGVRVNTRLSPEVLRLMLATIILCVFTKLFLGMVITPNQLYSFEYQ